MSDLSKLTCIEDLRRVALRRVPRMFYDYVAAGSWTESTLRINETDLQRLQFRQRVAADIEHRSISSTMLGENVAMPVAIAPTGLTGMVHADGEMLAARAAHRFGVPFTLSTMSICSIEDVARFVQAPFWFQLYVMRDKDFMKSLIRRAQEAQCSALVVTLDLQVMGQRHNDIKNGLSVPPKPTLRNLLNLATKPQWCLGMAQTPRRIFRNIVGHVKGVSDMSSLAAWTAQQFDPRLSWDDIKTIKDLWGGKLVLKGVMEVEDALAAVDAGADAIVVSNHGGRQLDGAPSSIQALPEIVRAVGTKTEVWMDSGIRSGQDVLRALAFGAKGTMIGRSFLYGLGAAGEAGVTRCLDIIAKELDLSMAFCGHNNIGNVNASILRDTLAQR